MKKVTPETTVARLSIVCCVAGALCSIVLCGLLGRGVFAGQAAASARRMKQGMERRLAEDQAKIEQAKKSRNSSVKEGLAAAGVFQARMEETARKHAVELSEFRSGTDLTPFLTAYAKDTPNEGWTQIEAKATVRGRLIDVMGCLTDLSHQAIPFEFDSVEMTRVMGGNGQILVAANLMMRVLTRPVEGKA